MKKMWKRFVFFVSCGLFVYSAFNLIDFFQDGAVSLRVMNELRDEVVIDNGVGIDFDRLKEINQDVVGWIRFGYYIDYPVVQGEDNDFYLYRSFDGSMNSLGTIFLSYDNDGVFGDRNNVVFGHNNRDRSKFGSLEDVFNDDFFDDELNNFITVVTDEGVLEWEIFSVYVYEAELYYLTTSFNGDEYFASFIETIKLRSIRDFGVDVDVQDRLLTLTACYGTGDTNYRTVIHARLVFE